MILKFVHLRYFVRDLFGSWCEALKLIIVTIAVLRTRRSRSQKGWYFRIQFGTIHILGDQIMSTGGDVWPMRGPEIRCFLPIWTACLTNTRRSNSEQRSGRLTNERPWNMLFSANRNGLFDQYQEIKSQPSEWTFEQWEALKYVVFRQQERPVWPVPGDQIPTTGGDVWPCSFTGE